MGKRGDKWYKNYWLIGGLVILALLLTSNFYSSSFIVSGYDGITAQIVDIHSERSASINNNRADAFIQMDGYWDGIFYRNPTGVKFEMDSAVDVLNSEKQGNSIKQVIDNGDGTDTIKNWDVYIVHCSMGVTIQTSGGGLDAAFGITYKIQLSENQFTVFNNYNDTYAFILEVYTLNYTNVVNNADVTPSSGGYAFPLTPVERSSIPSWFKDSGYNTNALSRLQKVTFDIKVNYIQPMNFLGGWRSESQATLAIGIDVFLVGYWEKTVAHGWEAQPVPNFWDGVLDFLGDLSNIAMGPLITLAVIAVSIVVIVIIIKFVVIDNATKFTRRG